MNTFNVGVMGSSPIGITEKPSKYPRNWATIRLWRFFINHFNSLTGASVRFCSHLFRSGFSKWFVSVKVAKWLGEFWWIQISKVTGTIGVWFSSLQNTPGWNRKQIQVHYWRDYLMELVAKNGDLSFLGFLPGNFADNYYLKSRFLFLIVSNS